MGEGIHEDVLRALVEQHAVRECLVARIGWPQLGPVDSPGGQRRTLGAGALAT